MEILFWIIFGPILFWAAIRIYSSFVADFSPDKKRRAQAKDDEARLAEASDKWFDMWFSFFWKMIKFSFIWILPLIILLLLFTDFL